MIDNQILDCGKNGYIYFNYADIFELKSRGIFRDNETNYEKGVFLKLCTKKLGKGSMLVMGSFDKGQYGCNIKEYFEHNGFKYLDLFYDSQVFIK